MTRRRLLSDVREYCAVPGRLEVPNHWARSMIDDPSVTPKIRAAALSAAGLTVGQLNQPLGFIPRNAETALLDALTARIGDPMFPAIAGLRGEKQRGGIVVYLLRQSATLREAFATLERYATVIRPSFAIRYVEDESRATLTALGSYSDPTANLTAWTFGLLTGLIREVSGRGDLPLEIELARTPRSSVDAWTEIFGVPVRDGCAADALIFSRDHASVEVSGADHELKLLLIGVAETMRSMAEVRDSGTVGKVQRALAQTIPRGRFALGDVARQMNLTARSLQRKLDEEETSFQHLLRDRRQELAYEYLGDLSLRLSEIAQMLGYVDQTSFTRAFKSMSGMTPTQFRQVISTNAAHED